MESPVTVTALRRDEESHFLQPSWRLKIGICSGWSCTPYSIHRGRLRPSIWETQEPFSLDGKLVKFVLLGELLRTWYFAAFAAFDLVSRARRAHVCSYGWGRVFHSEVKNRGASFTCTGTKDPNYTPTRCKFYQNWGHFVRKCNLVSSKFSEV